MANAISDHSAPESRMTMPPLAIPEKWY